MHGAAAAVVDALPLPGDLDPDLVSTPAPAPFPPAPTTPAFGLAAAEEPRATPSSALPARVELPELQTVDDILGGLSVWRRNNRPAPSLKKSATGSFQRNPSLKPEKKKSDLLCLYIYTWGSVGHGVQWDTMTEYHAVLVHRTMCKYAIIHSSPCPTEPLRFSELAPP